jgi:hypothetical protein
VKIEKITFKNKKAWLAIYSNGGEYLGTWHVINPEFVDALKREHPQNIKAW